MSWIGNYIPTRTPTPMPLVSPLATPTPLMETMAVTVRETQAHGAPWDLIWVGLAAALLLWWLKREDDDYE